MVAVPVGLCMLAQFELDDEVAGGLGTAALICGFIAFDAPARTRIRWQIVCAPFVGAAGALGIASSQTVPTAILAMLLVAGFAGYLVAVSLRLAVAGLSATLALLIAQGLLLDSNEILPALALGTAGGLLQAAMAGVAWLCGDRAVERGRIVDGVRDAWAKLRGALELTSIPMRHAIRFGAALAIGVAIYRIAGLDDHGYWIPLTILFVLKPDSSQTAERIAMRAAGTVVGLFLATVLAELLGEGYVLDAVTLTVAAALSYALLSIQYALFTTAITIFVVLLTDTLGTEPLDAVGERALGTLVGVVIAALAFKAFGELLADVEEAESSGVS